MVFYSRLIRRAGCWSVPDNVPNGVGTNSSLAAASLSLNLEKLIVDSVSVTRTISTNKDEIREIFKALDRLKLVLSILLTPGLSEDIDAICYGKLGAYPSTAALGLSRYFLWSLC